MKYAAINDRNARDNKGMLNIASNLLDLIMIYIVILIVIKFVKQGFRK